MKTKKLYIILFSILFLIGLNSCTKETITDPPAETNYTFGQVGNKWIYSHTSHENQTLPDASYEILQSMGNNVFKVRTSFPNSPYENIITFWYINQTNFAMNCDSTGTDLQFNISGLTVLNQTYTVIVTNNPFYNDGDTIYVKLLSFNTSKTVPAGTFNCLEIEVKGTPTSNFATTNIFISKSAGIIYQNNQYMTIALKSKNF